MPEVNNLPSCLIAVSQLPGWSQIPATAIGEIRKAGERFGANQAQHTELSTRIVKTQIEMGRDCYLFRKWFQPAGLWMAFQESNHISRVSALRWINEYLETEKLAKNKGIGADILEMAIAGGLKNTREEVMDQLPPPPPKRASVTQKQQYALQIVDAHRARRKGRGKAIRTPESIAEWAVPLIDARIQKLPSVIDRRAAVEEICRRLQSLHPSQKKAA